MDCVLANKLTPNSECKHDDGQKLLKELDFLSSVSKLNTKNHFSPEAGPGVVGVVPGVLPHLLDDLALLDPPEGRGRGEVCVRADTH